MQLVLRGVSKFLEAVVAEQQLPYYARLLLDRGSLLVACAVDAMRGVGSFSRQNLHYVADVLRATVVANPAATAVWIREHMESKLGGSIEASQLKTFVTKLCMAQSATRTNYAKLLQEISILCRGLGDYGSASAPFVGSNT